MAKRRVIWTSRADYIFSKILEYYINRNKSNNYSRKLNQQIKDLTVLLSNHPYIGRKTDYPNIRVAILENFKIFYQIKKEEILILHIWDSRQNPGNLNL